MCVMAFVVVGLFCGLAVVSRSFLAAETGAHVFRARA